MINSNVRIGYLFANHILILEDKNKKYKGVISIWLIENGDIYKISNKTISEF